MNPENITCAICLGSLQIGQGQAIFTAECSHSFHFGCLGSSVTQGNYLCPVCSATWNDLPFVAPNLNTIANNTSTERDTSNDIPQPQPPARTLVYEPELLQFSDDEPLPALIHSTAGLQNISIKAIPELPAVAASESIPHFAVLVGIKAPSLSEYAQQMQRAPIDLVMVLDVSGSMHGSKLALLKRAVSFVIDNLGPSDRLSVVSFSTYARRIFPLCRMVERGRADAKRAVNSLSAKGSTNIVEGLKKGVQVIEERRHQNPVASIIFLSDGRDTCNHGAPSRTFSNARHPPQYLHLLPASICPSNRGAEDRGQQRTFPVHAFGFGLDHDPLAMHDISDSSGGTFSFIESYEMVQDAFASCIGGLLSVVTQELRLMVRSASHGVEITSIPSGRYASEISNQGSQGTIHVGDLYADEEKEFMINLSVPALMNVEGEESERKTSILDITCSYKDIVSEEMVLIEADLVEIRRPVALSPPDTVVNLEVDRQRNRLNAAERITEAQRMAETGDLSGAKALLSSTRSTLLVSASGQAGDDLCGWLASEMKEIEARLGSMQLYERAGRAYTLSSMSCHGYQRATTRGRKLSAASESDDGDSSATSPPALGSYETPYMSRLVRKSQQQNINPMEG